MSDPTQNDQNDEIVEDLEDDLQKENAPDTDAPNPVPEPEGEVQPS